MDYFLRSLKHYLTLALRKSGAKLDANDEAEIDHICAEMASRLAVIERRLDVLEGEGVKVPKRRKPKRKPKKV